MAILTSSTPNLIVLGIGLLGLGLSPTTAFAAQKQAPKSAAGAQRNQRAPDSRPGAQALEKLSRMTPAQREKWLSSLPPARRQRIEQNLREFQKMPPAQQNRVRGRQELLNSLPPQRQNQVRHSVQQFLNMPEERKAVVKQEMRHMAPLSDDERRAYMSSEEFRNRYSATEQQMMGNLMEIEPRQ
jgi:Protein of unknown function (DUF3106)